MYSTKQLSVFLENRPGVLAHACNVLGSSDINIHAISVHDTVDQAVVRFMVDNPTKALLLLEQEGFYVIEQNVVVMNMANQPGNLGEISRRLALADININYAYATAGEGMSKALLILRTDEMERAIEALEELEA